jgi:hypothetical protein
MFAKRRRNASHIRYFINRRNNKSRETPRRERMPTTAGSQKQQKCQQQNDTAGKSAIAGKLATSGTACVVDTVGKFATGAVDTGGGK